MLGEFSLIDTYFNRQTPLRDDVELAIGDDCALLCPRPGQRLVVTTDTLVDGVHFTAAAGPRAIGHKALAVNLSDIAAMGAQPAWLSLALTLPDVDEPWLAQFSAGLLELADRYGVTLIGGDTTRGPLSITITAQGLLDDARCLRRDAGQPGDWIYVTGTLGDAAAALQPELMNRSPVAVQQQLLQRLYYPEPRVEAGCALRTIAAAGMDVSDGLAADLGHILKRSRCAAELWLESLPLSAALRAATDEQEGARLALNGGDDYELLFTIAGSRVAEMEQALATAGVTYQRIGRLLSGSPQLNLTWQGQRVTWPVSGFVHF